MLSSRLETSSLVQNLFVKCLFCLLNWRPIFCWYLLLLCNLYEWLEFKMNLESKCKCHENNWNDHQFKKLLIVKHFLLVSTFGNVRGNWKSVTLRGFDTDSCWLYTSGQLQYRYPYLNISFSGHYIRCESRWLIGNSSYRQQWQYCLQGS